MPLLTLLATAQAGTESIDKVQQLLQKLLDWGINAGGHIIGALLIFLIGRFLIGSFVAAGSFPVVGLLFAARRFAVIGLLFAARRFAVVGRLVTADGRASI